MRASVILLIFLSLVFSSSALAQPAQDDSSGGNLGSWKWGKPSSQGTEEEEEPETGETSWERLNAERKAEAGESPKEGLPQSLTPLQLWYLLRGKKDEQKSE